MEVIFDFTILYLLDAEKGKYTVQIGGLEAEVATCFQALAIQHPRIFEKLKQMNIIKDENVISAMMISGQQLLNLDSKITNNQEIKVIGQICGG